MQFNNNEMYWTTCSSIHHNNDWRSTPNGYRDESSDCIKGHCHCAVKQKLNKLLCICVYVYAPFGRWLHWSMHMQLGVILSERSWSSHAAIHMQSHKCLQMNSEWINNEIIFVWTLTTHLDIFFSSVWWGPNNLAFNDNWTTMKNAWYSVYLLKLKSRSFQFDRKRILRGMQLDSTTYTASNIDNWNLNKYKWRNRREFIISNWRFHNCHNGKCI